MQKVCEHCQQPFSPRPNVPDQQYCSEPECQKARRNKWRRRKRHADPDYKANQADAQRRWLESNRDYWRRYRRNHPEYTRRNRQLQKIRNIRRNHWPVESMSIAMSDGSPKTAPLDSGYYKLTPLSTKRIAKSDALIVHIRIIAKDHQ